MTRELLRQVRLLDPSCDRDQVVDVLLVDQQIEVIEPHLNSIPAGTEVQDCQSCILAPGLIDLYSQSGEPGFETRETLTSLSQAAQAGGFTQVNLLPHTAPVLDNPGPVAQLQAVAVPTQLQFWGAVTHGATGQHLTDLWELAQAGVVGFTDAAALPDWGLIRRVLEYLAPLKRPLMFWPWQRSLVGNGVAFEGPITCRLGLPGIPISAETVAIAGLLECVAVTQTPIHLMRVATARGTALIQAAKAQGLPITASTTWLQLLHNTTDLEHYPPSLRLHAPLGNPADQQALIAALESGVIDAIAVDHTPYTYEEKTVAFAAAPPGAIGLELALPLLWQRFVVSGQWSALDLWRRLSSQPAACLGQSVEAIAPQQHPDLILFNPEQAWTVTPTSLRSRSHNTHYLHEYVWGRVQQIYASA
ncbi:MAG: dihydroorotase [Cyanobacteria bacterium P01_H01_bin.121]